MNENVTVAQVAQVARTAIAIGDAQVARLQRRLTRIEEAIRAEHRPVKFTDVSLGIRDAEVCLTCHVRLDEPEDWPGGHHPSWTYPLVQAAWPCGAIRAFDSPAELSGAGAPVVKLGMWQPISQEALVDAVDVSAVLGPEHDEGVDDAGGDDEDDPDEDGVEDRPEHFR